MHQDVEFIANDWLVRAEEMLTELAPEGWCGVAGRTSAGRWRGLLRDRAMVFGEPFLDPLEVQTLDEVVLIHRNRGEGHRYFDDALRGWHAYGVDACCSALRNGAKNYVLPLPIWHDSNSSNLAGLSEAHHRVWQKHRSAFPRIYTTCGVLPDPYRRVGSYRLLTSLQWLWNWRYAGWLRLARQYDFRATPWETLEKLTLQYPVVECRHPRASFRTIEGTAFTDRTNAPRRIIHRFEGLEGGDCASPCLVTAPELARGITGLQWLPGGVRRLLICLYLGETHARVSHWRKVIGRPFTCALAVEADGTRWAILDVDI